jgi:hypothetical protein
MTYQVTCVGEGRHGHQDPGNGRLPCAENGTNGESGRKLFGIKRARHASSRLILNGIDYKANTTLTHTHTHSTTYYCYCHAL